MFYKSLHCFVHFPTNCRIHWVRWGCQTLMFIVTMTQSTHSVAIISKAEIVQDWSLSSLTLLHCSPLPLPPFSWWQKPWNQLYSAFLCGTRWSVCFHGIMSDFALRRKRVLRLGVSVWACSPCLWWCQSEQGSMTCPITSVSCHCVDSYFPFAGCGTICSDSDCEVTAPLALCRTYPVCVFGTWFLLAK